MKKILIVTPTLRSGGGVIRGLKNMLALLPENRYHIDVLPMGFSDSNNVILTNCNVLSDDFLLTAVTSIYSHTVGYKKRLFLTIIKAIFLILGIVNKRKYLENRFFIKAAKKYVGYDVVVAYQEGPCTRFVQFIASSYKIAWIHCDYSEYKKLCDSNEEEIYKKYQRIVCVSKFTLERFQAIYPNLLNRSLFIYNLLDKNFIRQSALEEELDSKKKKKIRLISVGRLHPVKQFCSIPNIISKMISLGAEDFEWVLIGDGKDSQEYVSMMLEAQRLSVGKGYFTYLGSKYNPYPYIKNSDILVSTSLSEACPFVVNEARVLGIPVVSNNYPSIYEFINDEIDGRIVPINKMSSVLTDLLQDTSKLGLLKHGMRSCDYNNDGIIERIITLFEDNSLIVE